MTKEEIKALAEKVYGECDWHDSALSHLEQLAKLVIEHEREAVANWIMGKGFATGHGDAIVDMIDELEWQVAEREREACAKVADEYAEGAERNYSEIIADKIRARGQE
jgi:hypothetical protein